MTTVQANEAFQWKKGRTDYLMPWDGEDRHFIVYIPQKYNPQKPTPLVFMFHGSGGTGQKMYNITTWKETADREGFVAVFPSAWKYYVLDKGRMQAKWNTKGMINQVKSDTKLMDDVGFVRAMVGSLQASIKVDDKRIYASGFSNGGGFIASRLLPEMSDVFAALSTGGSTVSADYPMHHSPIPLYQIVGSRDNKIYERSNIPIPTDATEWIGHAEYGKYIDNACSMLALKPTYKERDGKGHSTLQYEESTNGGRGIFVLSVVDGMGHSYPNGKNNPHDFNAPPHLWKFYMANPKK